MNQLHREALLWLLNGLDDPHQYTGDAQWTQETRRDKPIPLVPRVTLLRAPIVVLTEFRYEVALKMESGVSVRVKGLNSATSCSRVA